MRQRETAFGGSKEHTLRYVFRISLLLKAAHSVIELISGVALYAVSNAALLQFTRALTRHELLEDPSDVISNFLLRSAESFSIGQKSAASIYLLSHGAVKLFLVVMVLRERRWAYPLFMVALVLLISYQSYQLTLGLSLWLAMLTLLDIVILWMTWHEYRPHRASRS